MLSLIWLACGLPLLLFGSLRRSLDGPHSPTEIVIVQDQRSARARWFADGDFHERILRPWEREHVNGQESLTAFINTRDRSRMRLEPASSPTFAPVASGFPI